VRSLFQHSVHALDLAIGPGMFGFCQAVIDIIGRASPFEGVRPDNLASCQAFFNLLGC
jgi:hypothetical protein